MTHWATGSPCSADRGPGCWTVAAGPVLPSSNLGAGQRQTPDGGLGYLAYLKFQASITTQLTMILRRVSLHYGFQPVGNAA